MTARADMIDLVHRERKTYADWRTLLVGIAAGCGVKPLRTQAQIATMSSPEDAERVAAAMGAALGVACHTAPHVGSDGVPVVLVFFYAHEVP